MLGRVRTGIVVAAVFAGLIVPALPASANVAYHTVEYSIEAVGGASAATARYTTDLRNHADATEKHLQEDQVDLPWTLELQVGESDFARAGSAPDSKPFKGLDLGLTAISTDGMDLDNSMTDDGGIIKGPEAWNSWTGGAGRSSAYTCRITVDGEVVAEQTMKGLCSVQYKKRA
ncbi:hypothetical protein Srot_2595 [Segniliparus rotundus DSM 44985]|uniref:Uncharacterized protein n=1 Tax=Segniliparus rotundus (strain ATCC BAA-972 / CDC 1076 / CIP 108378 / DSM 44985 / JCM 13578) TaxID=640132 RepID=D6ZC61_SEGRD|nr:hypothetical protein [Segniliparus rotundus]ADG99030.1 hypothetical protein Srot_2595 [Segniliparus rotundus DSM 44985]